MNSFQTQCRPRFRQTDPAGILFFNEVFNLFHDAYEEWIPHLGMTQKQWFQNPEWAVPLKKAECEFSSPIKAFDVCDITVSVSTVGNTSFQLNTQISQNKKLCCEVKTVHVFIDKKTGQTFPIPDEIKLQLV